MFVLMILLYYAAEASGNFTNAYAVNGLSILHVIGICRHPVMPSDGL